MGARHAFFVKGCALHCRSQASMSLSREPQRIFDGKYTSKRRTGHET